MDESERVKVWEELDLGQEPRNMGGLHKLGMDLSQQQQKMRISF